MLFLPLIALVAWVGPRCVAVPQPVNSDLSLRAIPLELLDSNPAATSPDQRDADVELTSDAALETEKSSCLCPGTQIAVQYSGRCECIDDHFSGEKRDAELRCPQHTIGIYRHGNYACAHIRGGGGKRDAELFCPQDTVRIYGDGNYVCAPIRGGRGRKRANATASSVASRKAFCLRRICPNNLKPHFIDGPYNPINGNCVCS